MRGGIRAGTGLVDVHGAVVEVDVDGAVWVVFDYAVDQAHFAGVAVPAAMVTITVTVTVAAVGAGLTVSVLARVVEVVGARLTAKTPDQGLKSYCRSTRLVPP